MARKKGLDVATWEMVCPYRLVLSAYLMLRYPFCRLLSAFELVITLLYAATVNCYRPPYAAISLLCASIGLSA
eukprot:2640848-Rhodomonas_salina.1